MMWRFWILSHQSDSCHVAYMWLSCDTHAIAIYCMQVRAVDVLPCQNNALSCQSHDILQALNPETTCIICQTLFLVKGEVWKQDCTSTVTTRVITWHFFGNLIYADRLKKKKKNSLTLSNFDFGMSEELVLSSSDSSRLGSTSSAGGIGACLSVIMGQCNIMTPYMCM